MCGLVQRIIRGGRACCVAHGSERKRPERSNRLRDAESEFNTLSEIINNSEIYVSEIMNNSVYG